MNVMTSTWKLKTLTISCRVPDYIFKRVTNARAVKSTTALCFSIPVFALSWQLVIALLVLI